MTEKIDIKLKLQTLPEKPGIYQYFDKAGTIIYVGKAKNLKKRVGSYFNKTQDNHKTIILVKNIYDIHYIVVDTELDALLLENNLIKKYKPKYNIQLKDDKTYPWICIKKEPFPRIFSTRRIIKDGSRYFGPYPNQKIMYTMLDLTKQLFKLRTCMLDLSANKIEKGMHKVCLEYHIGNCKAPCVGKQTNLEYDGWISEIEELLKGNISSVIAILKEKMFEHARAYKFEDAQVEKEKIEVLERYKAKSTIVSPTVGRVDVITIKLLSGVRRSNHSWFHFRNSKKIRRNIRRRDWLCFA
jgi:excinuclease ABC subunit C